MTELLFMALQLELCFVCIKQGCHVNLVFSPYCLIHLLSFYDFILSYFMDLLFKTQHAAVSALG